jgi:hypothetical protein
MSDTDKETEHYDREEFKRLWAMDYKSLAMAPGQPNGRLREARFVLQARVALETRLLMKITCWMAVATCVMALATIALAVITLAKHS